MWLGRRGAALDSVPSDDAWSYRLSHDGGLVAQGGFGLWVRDLRRGVAIKLPTPGSETQSSPVWSPDDARIAYVPWARASGNQPIHVARADGSGEEAPLPTSKNGSKAIPMDWSRDGRELLVASEASATAPQPALWIFDLRSRTMSHWLTTPGGVPYARFSPDGRSVAYQSNDTGTPEVYLRPFPGPGASVRVSPAGGGRPTWRADGRELFYLTPAGDLTAVPIASSGLPDASAPRRLVPNITNAPDQSETLYDPTPDGQRFLIGVTNRVRPPLTLLAPWTLAITGDTR